MNFKQYWNLFKLAVKIQIDPFGFFVTDDPKIYSIIHRRMPSVKIELIQGQLNRAQRRRLERER